MKRAGGFLISRWNDTMLGSAVWLLVLLLVATATPNIAGESWNVDYLGCLPGYLEDTQVRDGYAFCAVRIGLLILDVSSAEQPIQVAFLSLPHASAVTIDGPYAYVSCGVAPPPIDGGVSIIDISDPESPVEIGYCTTPERPTEVIVGNGHVYVADSFQGLHRAIRIIDVSDPQQPVEVSLFEIDRRILDMDLVGNILYLANGYDGLRIFDVSNPVLPVELGSYDPGNYVECVAIRGDYAYISSLPGIRIIDISNPSLPVEVNSYDMSASPQYLTITGDFAYLSRGSSIVVLDLSKPTNPASVGALSLYGRPGRIQVLDGLAFVAGSWGGLRIVDVLVPSEMVEIGAYALLGDVSSVDLQGDDVYVTGGHFYSGGKNSDRRGRDAGLWPYAGLFTLGIGDPTVPLLLAYHPIGNATDVCVDGAVAYVADFSGPFRIFDVKDPAAPREIGSASSSGWTSAMAVAENLACQVNEGDMQLFDLTDLSAPVEVGNIDVGTSDAVIQGNFAYVTHYGKLKIVDISVPAFPDEVASLDLPQWAYGLDVAGNHAYVCCWGDGLMIVDISDPTSPVEIAVFDTPGFAQNVVMVGDHAYVADYAGGIRVLDVAVPEAPREVAYYVTNYPANYVAVENGLIVVGMSDGGLVVLRSDHLTGIESSEPISAGPDPCSLLQNSPNPFNPRTNIRFTIEGEFSVCLDIFSLDGRHVRTLTNERLPAGAYDRSWDGCDERGRALPSGTYFCRLRAGSHSATKPLVLVR